MTDKYYYDRGDGYVDPPPSSGFSAEKAQPATVVPAFESSSLIDTGSSTTVVYGGGYHGLPQATGSGRTHTVKNVGTVTAYVYAYQNEFVDGSSAAVPLPPNTSFSFLDYAIYQWASTGTTSEPTFYHRVVSDSDYTISGLMSQSVGFTTLTAARTVTMPPANVGGQTIIVRDETNSASWTNKITINRAGSDTFGASSTSVSIWVKNGSITLQSNGLGKWFIVARSPRLWYTRWLSSTSFVEEPDVTWMEFRLIAGGGSGGSAGLSGGVTYFGGGGGGAGTFSYWEGPPVGLATHTITVGAGGTSKAALSNLSGSSGTASSVGSLVTSNPGTGGTRGSSGGAKGTGGAAQSMASINVVAHPFAVVTSATFTLNTALTIDGGNGGISASPAPSGGSFPTSPVWFAGGVGGSNVIAAGGGGGAASPFGAGGAGGYNNAGTMVNGVAGSGYGSGGGGGAISTATADESASGAGAPGFVDAWITF